MEDYTGFEVFRTDKYGPLEIDEIYGFYDGPLIFTCRDASENLYFVYCMKIDVPHLTFMILPVSATQMEAMKNRKVTLRTFLYKHRFEVLQLREKYREDISILRPIENILPYLPMEGVYL